MLRFAIPFPLTLPLHSNSGPNVAELRGTYVSNDHVMRARAKMSMARDGPKRAQFTQPSCFIGRDSCCQRPSTGMLLLLRSTAVTSPTCRVPARKPCCLWTYRS